tara:strand:- start:5434 stop:6420 length:987 start_codon:yes stop_codon:yes gene_type:complete
MANSPVIWFDRSPDPALLEFLGGQAEFVWPRSDDPLDGLDTADVVIAGASLTYGQSVLAKAPKLKVVARAGIGFDNVVLTDATSLGIAICNTPDGPTISTAEHALALILSVSKDLNESQGRLRRQEGNYGPQHRAIELDGASLALIGLGRIGSRVAQFAVAMGMRVTAYDPFEAAERFEDLGVERASNLHDAVSSAHIVSIHAPLTPETRHLVDAELFSQMQDGVLIVNTARGGLIDDHALLAALNSGKVAGAGLDVTEPEPLPSGHPLLDHQRVVVTPHVASATNEGRKRIFGMALEQILCALGGIKPSHILNPEVWPGRNSERVDT